MEPTTPPSNENMTALLREANTRLARPNANIRDVTTMLVQGGMEQEKARELVLDILRRNRERDAAKDGEARKDMLIGGGIALVGITITAVTYYNSSGTGSYVVAWGAILFGVMRFFRGVSASN